MLCSSIQLVPCFRNHSCVLPQVAVIKKTGISFPSTLNPSLRLQFHFSKSRQKFSHHKQGPVLEKLYSMQGQLKGPICLPLPRAAHPEKQLCLRSSKLKRWQQPLLPLPQPPPIPRAECPYPKGQAEKTSSYLLAQHQLVTHGCYSGRSPGLSLAHRFYLMGQTGPKGKELPPST